jgi:hypothetical protein
MSRWVRFRASLLASVVQVTKVHFLRYAEVQYYRCDLSLVPVHFLHDAEVHFLAGGPGRETGGGHARTWLLRADTHFLEHLYLFV